MKAARTKDAFQPVFAVDDFISKFRQLDEKDLAPNLQIETGRTDADRGEFPVQKRTYPYHRPPLLDREGPQRCLYHVTFFH
jgi:hypothetical protein